VLGTSSPSSLALQYEPSDGKSPSAVENLVSYKFSIQMRAIRELNDYRPVLDRRMRLQVAEDLDPLQFAYQKHIGVEDAVLYILHRA